MIAVFAYAFAHRKTQDFLLELALAGKRDVVVIGASSEPLPSIDRTLYFHRTLKGYDPLETPLVAQQLGFDYVEMKHSETGSIVDLVREKRLTLGIVAGARILRRPVIEAFSEGIVNFHPGKIPETSGLDAFFYTLKNNVDAGVTTHFIDARVDAGQELAFDAAQVGADDTVEVVQENTYRLQVIALRRFLSDRDAGRLKPRPLDRPQKNEPMRPTEKWELLLRFPMWRATRVLMQAQDRLLTASAVGATEEVQKILSAHPQLLEVSGQQGWSPLIQAAFNQHKVTVSALLDMGANPNATGRRGTSVLMYAKTALMDSDAPDFALLDLLLARGAKIDHRDNFGKNILHYVAGSAPLTDYFKRQGAGE